MVNEFNLNESLIQFETSVSTWEEAIIKSAQPLLDGMYVDQGYIDAMIESVNEYGPYIVIAPKVAMPHARPETGSKKIGYSILKLEQPIGFSEAPEHQVELLVALSCVNAESHLEILQFIVEVLSDAERFEGALKATTKTELLDIFSR
ncbi:MAG: PTS sugar transporter subunit IIA [Clostridiales bacterium]|nr:PTS sugar transporter subunit IIA [Clostridiales bacterium]